MRILPAWWLPLMVDVCSCSVISECYNKSLQKPNIVPSHIQKNGLYKTSNFGWLTSRFRIIQITNFERYITIQKWIVWNIHFWMTKKHIWNHPKTNCTKSPVWMTYTSMFRTIQIWKTCIIYRSSKFGWFHPLFNSIEEKTYIYQPNLDDILQH